MSKARERRRIKHRREVDASGGPYALADMPELSIPGAQLNIYAWYDDTQVYLKWATPETDEEWAARLAKLDKQAAKRAASVNKCKLAAEKRKQEQEAAERELYERLKRKYE